MTLSLDTVEGVMVGEVDELEEDVGWSISCLEGVVVVEEGNDGGRTRWQSRNHDGNEVFCVALYPNPVFNEMWFIDHWSIHKNICFHSLSQRQYWWRVFEAFHSQECPILWHTLWPLHARLHFSIGCYDCRWTSRRRQSIHFSRIQVLLADHMQWRTGVDNKFSSLRFKIWCRQAPVFRWWEECCFVFLFEF